MGKMNFFTSLLVSITLLLAPVVATHVSAAAASPPIIKIFPRGLQTLDLTTPYKPLGHELGLIRSSNDEGLLSIFLTNIAINDAGDVETFEANFAFEFSDGETAFLTITSSGDDEVSVLGLEYLESMFEERPALQVFADIENATATEDLYIETFDQFGNSTFVIPFTEGMNIEDLVVVLGGLGGGGLFDPDLQYAHSGDDGQCAGSLLGTLWGLITKQIWRVAWGVVTSIYHCIFA